MYRIIINYIFFIKKIYRKKNIDNTVNSVILAFSLLFLNIHSLLIFIEIKFRYNLQLKEFWLSRNNGVPKVIYGYVFASLLYVFFYFWFKLISRRINILKKNEIFRSIISKSLPRWTSILYVFFTIFLFFYTGALLLSTINSTV